MASHTRHLFDFVEVRQDTITHGALACENMLFIQHLAIVASSDGIAVYKLKDKVPESLAGLDIEVQEHCFSYIGAAHEKGLTISLAAIFPFHNLDEDFDFQEIGAQSWQPKLDVLTERFDALDVINSLDQELIDEFVEQLSAGGDAFALIDAKVLVETTRATGVEAANASAILAEIAAREADVDAEAAAALGARATIQAEVDQNEADIAQEIVDRVADVQAEETRALGVESTNATAILTETNNRIAAVSAEAGSRAVAIAAAVANLIDSAPGALDTLNELAAALGDDASFSASVTTSLAGKQGQTIYLDAVNSAQRTTEQLQSLDTTTSIATHLSDEETRALAAEAVNAGLVAAEQTRAQGVESTNATAISNESSARATAVSGVQSDLDDVELVLGDRTAVQIARVDASSSIQGQLDAKAADAVVVKKTGNQTIAQNSTAAVLILTNTNSDAPILTCVGGDGEIRLSGGNVLECDRAGSMYVRASDGSGNVTIQSRGSSKFVCDDKVRLKVETSAEKDFSVENAKKVKFVEASANGSHAISLKAPDSVSADVDFVLPGADGSAGQVLQTDGNGALSFAAGSALSESADESISGQWSFTDLRPKKHAVDTDTTHNTWDSNTGVKRPLGSQDILGKLLIWRPTSSPGHNATWELPTAPAIGTVLWVINANNHNVKYIIVTAGGTDELYKKDLQTAVADGDCKVKIYEQDTFIYVASGVWVYMPQV